MQRSAGVLVYRLTVSGVDVLLGHMGGPYWAAKDDGAWSIPKGLLDPDDADEWAAAQREFAEEFGQAVPPNTAIDLGVVRQNRGKEVHVWAVPGDLDATQCSSTTFEMEWPPRSGRLEEFPEIDRAAWFDVETARQKIVAGQRPFLDTLLDIVLDHPPRPRLDTLPDVPPDSHSR